MPRRKSTQIKAAPPAVKKRGRPPKVKILPIESIQTKPRGRPPKVKILPIESIQTKPRGRPRKAQAIEEKPTQPTVKTKPRGRPRKAQALTLPVKPRTVAKSLEVNTKTPQEKIIEEHCFYPAAVWIEKHINTPEEAYLRKTSKRHGLTMIQNIMDHMLGYFSITGSELGKAIKESRKHTQYNGIHN